MKRLLMLIHPVVVLCLFATILISGEHFGGLYILYILMALPHGGMYSLFASFGAALLILSLIRYKPESGHFMGPLLDVFGIFSLYASLYTFFLESGGYNRSTFEQGIPFFTIVLFVLLSLTYLIVSISRFSRYRRGRTTS